VAKVDELMALCDRLEAQQQEREEQASQLARASLARFADAPTPANLEYLFHSSFIIPPSSLRRSILTLAVQGKLVPQDPNDEPAEEIVAGIAGDVAKAVRAKRMRNSRPIPAYEDEFPFDLPVGWTWAPLGTLTAAEDGAMCDGPFGSKLKTEHYIPTKGFAVLRLGNIGVGYFIHGKEGHISREHFESLPSNHTAPGDLLVAGLADPLVRCCEIPPDIGPAVNKSDCFRVRVSERMERSYVRHYLNSPIAKAFAAEENHGMTRERINLANAKALPVSIPPLAEQRRIVAKVEQLMALVDALETQLAASRATAANLFSALVAELTAG
jgi:type I restriction enzyme S subunit